MSDQMTTTMTTRTTESIAEPGRLLDPLLSRRDLYRPGILDRVAMRLGLWLILWGSRVPKYDTDRDANREYLETTERGLRNIARQDLHRPY
jgi:hypothetical protein